MISHPNRSKKTATARKVASSVGSVGNHRHRVRRDHDHDYSALLIAVRSSFTNILASFNNGPIFQTDVEDLNELYLDSMPSQRQVHNCSACRHFIQRFGGLAMINAAGGLEPVMWQPPGGVPQFYRAAFEALAAKVRKARIVSVFMTKHPVWGTPKTGEWAHMAVTPPASAIYRERALTAGQASAAVRENVKTVFNAMVEYTPKVLDAALRVLESGHLDRAEKFIGPVKWLRALHDWPKGRSNQRIRDNLLWQAVATAPEGFCHIKSSVVAPLLDDIIAGVSFETLRKKHARKVDTTIYQRPQAAPTAGNVAAAEALFEKLDLAPALERRFARLDDLVTIWTPPVSRRGPAPAPGHVFGHLYTKDGPLPLGSAPATLPKLTITWEKFARTVLPKAERLEIFVPARGRFIAMTTAVNADAPPILKWDREEARNPVAWYVYPTGSSAMQWKLQGGQWAPISAVVPLPTLWGDRPMSFLHEGVVLVIDGAMDTQAFGNAIFPETLRDDLHGVRSTIEAYSKNAKLHGREDGSACGYDIRKTAGRDADCTLRVFADGAWSSYQVDRWD